MALKNKVGRPKKKASDKLSKYVCVSFTERQYKALSFLASKEKKQVVTLCRESALSFLRESLEKTL